MPEPSAQDVRPPLKPVVFHILLALAEGDCYGYGVVQRVREASGQRITLETGPFYRHLRRLLDDGWVEESAGARPAGDDPRRGAYYRLTDTGRASLAAESARLAGLVDATARLGLLGGRGAR